jgi:hypothetical protein
MDSLANKSSNLQHSAGQFSQLASHVREDQLMQQYKFYAGVGFTFLLILLFAFFWSSPGKLMVALLLVGMVSGTVFMYFQRKRQRACQLVDRIHQRQRDPELGATNE